MCCASYRSRNGEEKLNDIGLILEGGGNGVFHAAPVEYIRDVAGTQLTEDVVEAFLRLVEQEKLRAPDDDGGGNMTEIDNVK